MTDEVEGFRWLTVMWNDEDWCDFYCAVQMIEHHLGVSRGVAERTLREQCSKGEVRSIRGEREKIEVIRPSEWDGKQLDLAETVAVNEDDFVYWMNEQPSRQRPKLDLGVFLIEQLEQLEQQSSQDTEVKRAAIKRDLARRAINELWQGKVPDTVTNSELVQRVGQWITDYCKRENSPEPEISPDTILRAAGRK